jgi:hypothetical protein
MRDSVSVSDTESQHHNGSDITSEQTISYAELPGIKVNGDSLKYNLKIQEEKHEDGSSNQDAYEEERQVKLDTSKVP